MTELHIHRLKLMSANPKNLQNEMVVLALIFNTLIVGTKYIHL